MAIHAGGVKKYIVRLSSGERTYLETISRKKRERPPIEPIFDGEAEARLIQLACSALPAGHACWSLRLLESKVVELGIVKAAIDYAHVLRDLADIHFAAAEKIILVQDNLNTHCPAALYKAFAPQEARRLVERFEWHYTPKHGSWLNMAETELSVLSTQCLDWRIGDEATLGVEVSAWETIETNTTQKQTGTSQTKPLA